MTSFDFRPRTRLLFGAGEFARLGEVAREQNGTRCLLVADPGMVEAGYVNEATRALKARRMEVCPFHAFTVNPTAAMVEAARDYAAPLKIDLIVGLGGGSSIDFAKAVNLLLTNGGAMRDYWGFGKAQRPLLPMMGIPTTAGPGTEALSEAWIFDSETGVRMACGDPKIFFRVVILDPKLTVTQSRSMTAASGYDAISHALETLASTRRTPLSECFSREAWRLLNTSFERVLTRPDDLEARGAMLLGSHLAGVAVENSMLGAAHACAHPLTADYNIPHGVAVALVLPRVLEWDRAAGGPAYDEFGDGELAARLRGLAATADFPMSLRDVPVPWEALPRLAEEASTQWTGRFSTRPFDAPAALEIYQAAY